jgi:hypothetical protein
MVVKYPGFADKALQAGASPTSICSKSELNAWVTSNKTNYAIFKDPDGAFGGIQSALGGTRKTMYVIEWASMKILSKTYQDDAATWTFLGTL